MVNMAEITSKLTQRTRERRIAWKPTADRNSFVAVVGGMNVIVCSEQESQWSPFRARLDVLDGKGTRIASAQHNSDGLDTEFNPGLVDLYDAARSAALNVDEQLKELLAALDSDQELG